MRAKIRAVLKGSRGETLMEGVASILVFTILIASVTLTIMVSLRMTALSNEAARTMQEDVRTALEGSDDDDGEDIVFTFTITGGGVPVTVKVTVTDAGAFRAFAPQKDDDDD